ncbi:MAG: rhomboid family intramembrane serine protease [Geminicoccales bacterium]
MPAWNQPITLLMRCIFCVVLASIVVAAFYPNLRLPEPIVTRGFTDKIYHVLGFLILVWLAGTAWRWTYKQTIVLLVFAVALELSQLLTEGRVVDRADMMANVIGVALGLMLLWMMAAWRGRSARYS